MKWHWLGYVSVVWLMMSVLFIFVISVSRWGCDHCINVRLGPAANSPYWFLINPVGQWEIGRMKCPNFSHLIIARGSLESIHCTLHTYETEKDPLSHRKYNPNPNSKILIEYNKLTRNYILSPLTKPWLLGIRPS